MEPQEPPGQFLTVTARLALPGIPAATHTNTQNTMSKTTAALCRRRTLKVISSRPVLITICTLVVIECACVLAELMVDLQGIKFRFENEEKELNRFVTFLIEKYPAEFATWTDSRSVEDVVNRIKDSLVVRSDKDIASAVLAACPCSCPPQTQSSDTVPSAVAGEYSERGKAANYGSQQGGDAAAASGASANSPARTTRQAYNNGSTSGVTAYAQFNPADVFVLEVNNVKESFFLVAEYVPDHIKLNETKHYHYETEYDKIHKASTALHIASLVILSVMVIETIIKFVCMGTAFLKKKFEVFDAFIVISSFALDFVFLDSRWYETGKDAATILVLMLPWRVVRIVNSFLMTVKHKHHIEIMTIKRAKKRADFKNAKLQTLLTEIRKDVNLLVALCRNSHVPESDIYACLYGLGRRSQTLNAVTSCTTIMLVSALGKDASVEDEIYGRLFADALRDPAEQDSEPEAKKLAEEAIDAAIQLDEQLEQQHKKAAKNSLRPRLLPKRAGRGQVTRSYTVPRRSASIDDNIETSTANAGSASPGGGSNVFYVNDAFATHRASEKAKKRHAVSSPETLVGLAGDSSGGGGSCSGGSGTSPCLPVAEEESCEGKGEGAETVSLGGGGAGAKDSWEGRLPPKCKSKASVRSLPGPGPGQNFVTFEVTTQVTYL